MERIDVAAAVVQDSDGRILLARRPEHLHQGGLWEFPGGKVEPDESAYSALQRELNEELGIRVDAARPLIRIQHAYPDRRVLLDVWRVITYAGEPHGREGQPIIWTPPQRLHEYELPAANRPIVNAVRLSCVYLITPEPGEDVAEFLHVLERLLGAGVRLVQLRVKRLGQTAYAHLAGEVYALCKRWNAQLLLNADPETVASVGTCGVHLSSARLLRTRERPLGRDRWVAASCHNLSELRHAQKIGVDFVVLSPVAPTPSHPWAPALGWSRFRDLTEQCVVPVFALGGMDCTDMDMAYRCGGQGIAAISTLWEAGSPSRHLAQCFDPYAGTQCEAAAGG